MEETAGSRGSRSWTWKEAVQAVEMVGSRDDWQGEARGEWRIQRWEASAAADSKRKQSVEWG